MDDLVAFLGARLDEDEHIAKMAAEDASAGAHWHVEATYPHSGHAGIRGESGEVVVFDEGSPAQMEAEHIARYDPARALREVAAKRRHLDQYRMAIHACQMATADEANSLAGYRDATWGACLADAAVYSDHPDYQQEWKP